MVSALKTLAELRAALKAAADEWDIALAAFEGADPDSDEYAAHEKRVTDAQACHRIAKVAVERREALEEAKAALPVDPAPEEPASTDIRVGREPLTYERHAPHSIFRDMWEAKQGDHRAQERLNRHRTEMDKERRQFTGPWAEQRAISTTDGAGGEFVPPLWLQEQWIPLQRAARPIANTLNMQPLPPGTDTINLPKVSTGTAVAVQTDGNAVQSTDLATTSVTGAVQTIAGQQDVSQQLVDLSVPGIDRVIFDDIARAYGTKIDVLVITGTVTNAKGLDQLSGTNAVTFTATTPTVPLLYPKVADAVQQIHTGRFLPPQVVAMHPRRWGWILASLDSQNRPLVVPNGQAFNQAAVLENVASENLVGGLMGLPVIVDASIPTTKGAGTNEDEIFVYRADDLYLYESAPKLRVFEEVLSNTLQVRYQIYGYYCLILGRLPVAISKITGTGNVAPTF